MLPREYQRRSLVLAGVALLAFLVLFGQLTHLQVLRGDQLAQAAAVTRTKELPTPAPRGRILDRNGADLATNRPANALVVHYPYYKDRDLLARLAQLTGRPLADLERQVAARLDPQRDGRLYEPVLVQADISPALYAQVVERRAELPGVEVVVAPVRHYPGGELAAHVVGYVARDQGTGQAGLERQYDRWLQGRPGRRQVQVDSAFAPAGIPRWVEPPVPGHDLVLTLDARLQRAAQRALAWQIWRIRNISHPADGRTWPATAGAAVVLDVHTGAVLALASYPNYDPNVFVQGPDSAIQALLADTAAAPLWNRAVAAAYRPGSTWKMVTASAALAAGVRPEERVYSGPVYGPTSQREWQGGWG